ncbi:hypothetical protein Pyn_18090 [Prunus yedoensis var. nudiflora]|uniref:Uncharacterized protein n=1 Tax=Prunus yedoensis var. nudiflora TaxID=2094558 RepID=A0A314XTJ0_PRUYE|nr:hypothetical protein Pyn_18090 [Prunus yedoensis var. nudiflora]
MVHTTIAMAGVAQGMPWLGGLSNALREKGPIIYFISFVLELHLLLEKFSILFLWVCATEMLNLKSADDNRRSVEAPEQDEQDEECKIVETLLCFSIVKKFHAVNFQYKGFEVHPGKEGRWREDKYSSGCDVFAF